MAIVARTLLYNVTQEEQHKKHSLSLAPPSTACYTTHLLCGTLGQQIDVLIVWIVVVFGGLHSCSRVGLGRRLVLQIEIGRESSGLKVGKSCQKIISICGQSSQLIVMVMMAVGG